MRYPMSMNTELEERYQAKKRREAEIAQPEEDRASRLPESATSASIGELMLKKLTLV